MGVTGLEGNGNGRNETEHEVVGTREMKRMCSGKWHEELEFRMKFSRVIL